MNTPSEIKEAVRSTYGEIATSGSACCGPNCCAPASDVMIQIVMNESYAAMDQAIAGAADLGLGCGTPTAFADLRDGMTVLDLGSGAGIDVFLSAKQIAPSGLAIGVDMTDAMIERARANQKKLGIINAEFRKGEIENLPVAAGSVDRIISNCVLNLVPDKSKAFAEMYRVMKPGGRFTVSDIVSVGSIPESARTNLELWAGCIAGAVEQSAYLQLMRDAGFTNVHIVSERPYAVEQSAGYGLLSVTVAADK